MNKIETTETIEQQILNLKTLAEEYNEMSDTEKIKNIDKYNLILKEREKCIENINNYKNIMENINNIEIDNNTSDITELFETVNNINSKINNNDVSELIKLYTELLTTKKKIESELDKKKLEIISL